MTRLQFEKFASSKRFFKVSNETKTIYTIADNPVHAISRFAGDWNIVEISREEFEKNYFFDEN